MCYSRLISYLFPFFLAMELNGEEVRLPIIKDNSIVMVDGEWSKNAGNGSRLRIKGNQHIAVLAPDTSSIQGRKIKKATLVCLQDQFDLSGISLSTVTTDWDENRSNGQWCGIEGIADWGYSGARFPAVCGGNNYTLVKHVESEAKDGIYRWAIPADMIHAIALGCSFGLAIHEDDADYRRNPTIFSREQSGREPYILVELDASDSEPLPEPPSELKLSYAQDDSLRLSLMAPRNGFAYEVLVNGVPLGRHNIPFVVSSTAQTIPVRDLPAAFVNGQSVKVSVTTMSRTGQRSKTVDAQIVVRKPARVMPSGEKESRKDDRTSSTAVANLGIIPVLDKYDSTGGSVGELPDDYLVRNVIYDGQQVRLRAAAGEVVGFQMLIRGNGSRSVQVKLPGIRVDQFHARYVTTGGRSIPDPLLPLPDTIPLAADMYQSVVVDLYIPFESKPGIRHGVISISDGRVVPLAVEVLPFSIPREATFFCEMNGYGLPDKVSEYYQHQQIAYDHRVHANILHYSHNSAAPGSRKTNLDMRLPSGRRMDNKRYDDIGPDAVKGYWDDFTEAFGPFLDGSYFARGHRGAIAAPGFYLSFHESWPLHCRAYFNGNPDAYAAFDDPAYARTYINLLQDFAELARSKSWTKCRFQVYFNNKGSLREPTKAPWILDEPASFWDYRALRYYGELTNKGLQTTPEAPVRFRIDISRPEFCRGQLNGRKDLWVVASSAFENYRRLVTDRIERDGLEAWVYGTSNHVHQSNRSIQAWALDAWTIGATGIVPWQTVNKTGSALQEADQLGLFIYESSGDAELKIRHSLRLKAYREAQQLIELLNLLKARNGWNNSQMRQFVEQYVDLSVNIEKLNEEDAGTSGYSQFSAQGADQLRMATIDAIRN